MDCDSCLQTGTAICDRIAEFFLKQLVELDLNLIEQQILLIQDIEKCFMVYVERNKSDMVSVIAFTALQVNGPAALLLV